MQIKDIQFNSEFNIEGMWWIPEEQEYPISGNLSYSFKDGIILKTLGHFKSIKTQNNKNKLYSKNYQAVIYGTLISGLQVSLFECYQIFYSVSFSGGYPTQKLHISTAFFGKHLIGQKVSHINFKRMTLYLEHLEDWLGVYPITYDDNISQTHKDQFNGFTLTCNPPPLPSFIIEQIGLRVDFSSDSSVSSDSRYHMSLNYKCSVSITSTTEKSFNWFSQVATDLENFLSLLSDIPSQRIHFLLYTNKEKNEYVSVLHSITSPIYKKKNQHFRLMIIPFKSIEKDLKNIFKLWFEKTNSLRPVFDLFFLVANTQNLHVKSQFLHLTQAVEIFHRKKNDSSYYLPVEEFEKFKKIITATIHNWPPEKQFREAFTQGKLKYANEFSLRTRFKKIISSLETNFKNNFFGNEREFINDVVILRNNLTHQGSSDTDQSELKKLLKYTMQLSILLSYLILTEIGVPKALVSKNLINRRKNHLS